MATAITHVFKKLFEISYDTPGLRGSAGLFELVTTPAVTAALVPVNKRFQNEIKDITPKNAVRKAFQANVDMKLCAHQNHILLTDIPAPSFIEEAQGKRYLNHLTTCN